MKNILLALVCLIGSLNAACAADYRCDATGGVMYQSERVVNLPQDQNQLYVTVIGDPTNHTFQETANWFATHPQLKQIANGTHFSVMETTSPMYRGRCEQSKDFAPKDTSCCVRVQTADGQVIYQVSGKNMPLSAEGLCSQLQTNCFRRGHLQPQSPSISYNFNYNYDMPVEKQDTKKEEGTDDVFSNGTIDIPVWFYCVAGGASIALAIGFMFAKEYKKHGHGK